MRTWVRWLVALAATLAVGAGTLLARGGGGCLAGGTLVATPRGDVAIEQLRVGETVWSEAGGRRIEARVVALSCVAPESFIELTTADGHTLVATPEHPCAVTAGTFAWAAALPTGTALLTAAGSTTVTTTSLVPGDRPAYNLLVAPGGVFFANGVLVHNKGCFLPDTPVLLADGTRRAISEIKPGDTVLAFDAAGRTVPARVANILSHEVDRYLVVRTEHVELHVTEEHPFYVGHGTFKTVGALRVGDTVYAHDGAGRLAPQRLLALERVTAKVTVYNLQTDDPHTYFADGIAVHNKGGGCFAAGTRIATPDGDRAIEDLALGDAVLAPDAGGAGVPAIVEGVYLNFAPLLTLHTDRGALRTTDEHPLLAAAGTFARADAFSAGANLTCLRGMATVLRVERGLDPVPVYTLSVGAAHTFVADGFVVHNKGGGGFHSGGYHGGYGGSGGGGGDPSWFLFVVIAAVVIIIIVAKAREGGGGAGEELDYCFSRSALEGKAAKTRTLLEFIAKVDEKWTPAALATAARETFLELQRCWSAREYAPMQARLMPDLYAEHCAQLAGMRQTHEINLIDQLFVEAVDIVHVHYTDRPAERTFTALITARACDYYLDDRTREFLRGDTEAARFQEFWTFQLLDGRWLLREIEQSRESDALTTENFFAQFTDTGRDQVYGKTAGTTGPAGPALPEAVLAKDQKIDRLLNFLVQTDKIWNRDEMLATTRRVFLNVVLAWQDGRPEAFASLALAPELAAHLRAVNEANQRSGTTVEFRNLCVRKVEIVHVDNRDDRTLDNFTARIGTHAQVVVTRGGAELRHDPDVVAWVEFWTFSRDGSRWVAREILPAAEGESIIGRENVDEGSSAQMLEWYYSKTRAT